MRNVLAASILAVALSALPAGAQSRSTIRDVQQSLKDKGIDPGPVDGINGPETKAAVKKYQEQQNLNEDGRIGPKTLASLGVTKGAPKTEMKTGGEQVKNSYSEGGKEVGQGGKELGHDVAHGKVGDAAVDLGKGVGHGAVDIGKGTGHAAKSIGKGIKNAVVPSKTDTTKQ